jgi:hypothetical protein
LVWGKQLPKFNISYFIFFGFEIWRYNSPIHSGFRYTTLIRDARKFKGVVYQFFGSQITKALKISDLMHFQARPEAKIPIVNPP